MLVGLQGRQTLLLVVLQAVADELLGALRHLVLERRLRRELHLHRLQDNSLAVDLRLGEPISEGLFSEQQFKEDDPHRPHIHLRRNLLVLPKSLRRQVVIGPDPTGSQVDPGFA